MYTVGHYGFSILLQTVLLDKPNICGDFMSYYSKFTLLKYNNIRG